MINFGILGAANIAPKAIVYPCASEPGADIACVGARDLERAQGFAHWHDIANAYDSYGAVIADPEIQAVYNPLPISLHHEWTIKALRAGKHVLCEKSMASNATEAREMADVAAETGLVLMDAFHYRYHPVFIRAKEIVDSGELGQITSIDAVFNVGIPDPDNIRNIYEMGGGATMDLGCYPLSWVRHLSGEEPVEVSATAVTGAPNVDVFLSTELVLPSGIRATTSSDMRAGAQLRWDVEVHGDRGRLHVTNPLAPQLGHRISVTVDGQERIETRDRRTSYSYQLDAFLAAVNNGAPLHTDGEDAVKQATLIDRCYEAAGLPLRGL